MFCCCNKLKAVDIPKDVKTIGDKAFFYCISLTSVSIPENLTSIGTEAFCNCSNLSSLSIPKSVISFGETPFENCTGELTVNCNIPSNCFSYADFSKVVIGDGVTSIGTNAFYNCANLTSLSIPKSVTTIGNSAFCYCTGELTVNSIVPSSCFKFGNFSKVFIGDGVTSIGDSAFYSCRFLTSITIPESVNSIGDEAFNGCSKLAAIIIPSDVTRIGNYTFYGCESLASINIPQSVTEIGDYAFNGCRSLSVITIPSGVLTLGVCAFEGCAGKLEVNCNIPEGTMAYPGAFRKSKFNEVVIGPGVTTVGSFAFIDCQNLTSITIPEGITEIGEEAFEGCSSLTSVHIGSIGSWCNIDFYDHYANPFTYASNLYLDGELVTEIIIPDTVTKIKNYAFYNCKNLKSVAIPESVVSVGSDAFERCSNLTSVHINSIDSWCNINFETPASNPLYYAIYASRSLYLNGELVTEVIIPNAVAEIKDYVFYNCSGLASITIPENLASIGSRAFEGCSKLTSVHINSIDSWCNINFETSTSNPLYYAKNLYLDGEPITELAIPETIADIKRYSFYNCNSLSSITIPKSVVSIGTNAFYGCENLALVIDISELDIRKGNTNNGYVAYYAQRVIEVDDHVGDFYFNTTDDGTHHLCHYIGKSKELALPKDYNGNDYKVGPYAFVDCKGLVTIDIPECVTAIEDNAFKGCDGLINLFVGANVDTYGENAFEGCVAVEKLIVFGSVMPQVPSEKMTSITLFSPIPLETEEFANRVYRNATLYVPENSVARYQTADVWKNFWNIVGFDPTGVDNMDADVPDAPIYTMQGVRVNGNLDMLPTGVYLQNGKKIYVNQ